MDLYYPKRVIEADEEPAGIKRIAEVPRYGAHEVPRARVFARFAFLTEVPVVGAHVEPLHPAVSERDAGEVIRAAFRNGKQARFGA